jgi:hypothetical protein
VREHVTACRCEFCSEKLEPAQELRFLVETATLDDPIHLNRIRMLPARHDGSPFRVCKSCHDRIETRPWLYREEERGHQRKRTQKRMLVALGALSLGWFLGNLLAVPRV